MGKSKKAKPAYAAGMADTLAQMAEVYALGTVGTVSLTDGALMAHRLSSACHARIGLEGQRMASVGEMLLMVMRLGALDGMTGQQMCEQAAEVASSYAADAVTATEASERLSAERAAGV